MLAGDVSMRSTTSRRRASGRAHFRFLRVHAGKDVDFADRAVATLPYLVPLFDGLKYGESATVKSSNMIYIYVYLHDTSERRLVALSAAEALCRARPIL